MKSVVITLVAASALLASCENKTGTGALVGGILGAGAGAGIGAAISGGSGAAIGAGAGAAGGALIGGLIGNELDKQDRDKMERRNPKTLSKLDNKEALSTYDVKEMSYAGINDKVIINQIETTNSRFNLSKEEIADLREAGVSQNVLDVMTRS